MRLELVLEVVEVADALLNLVGRILAADDAMLLEHVDQPDLEGQQGVPHSDAVAGA